MFASRTQRVVEIPFDVPHTVTIQKLSGRQIEAARQAKQAAAAEKLKAMGGAAFQRELNATGGTGQPGEGADVATLIAKVQANPLNSYDRYVVCQKGIKAWTCVDEAGVAIPVTPETIEDLGDEAADFFARAILELTLPARDEAGKKKD